MKRATKTKAAQTFVHDHEHDYSALLTSARASFDAVTSAHPVLFRTDAADLNALYLDALPAERQVHTCSCCRRFIETYGGLVAITTEGVTVPAMWNPDGVPDFYRPAFEAISARVRKARVTSLFRTKEAVWGNPVTGKWSHLSVMPPASFVYRERALTAGQAMAAAKENFRTVAMALSDLTAPMLDEALRILEADALARSEKFIGPVRWLRQLHERPKGKIGENMLWLAIATAPEGYCHPRASVIGPLLENIAAGLPFAEIKAKFEAMLHPLRYQRPTAAPTAGNIKAAEELVAKLGIAPSLERRFARLDEVKTIWAPKALPDEKPADGVFGHLKAKGRENVPSVILPPAVVTWEKFARTVLADAAQMEIRVPYTGNFIALTTAVHADAPPIMKWDHPEERNPVAWYVYHGGSQASQWRLAGGAWVPITAVVPPPPSWGSRPMDYLAHGVVLVIQGAADTRENSGNALFPECLKEELHGARSTIEAYSRTAKVSGREEASACGYHIGRQGRADCLIRVRNGNAWNSYQIDRWD